MDEREKNKRIREFVDAIPLAPQRPILASGEVTFNKDFTEVTSIRQIPEANALAKDIRDAKRYRAIKRSALWKIDSADDYGYEAESIDKWADDLVEWLDKFDKNEL